jgi:hypothetical protein
MFRRPADLYDRIFTEHRVERVERFIIYMAAAGLLIHVAVIAAGQLGLGSERLAELAGPGYLSALYTPFSFILVFEVFGLVLALSRSFSNSIAVQYQIMALIFVRRIFGDIGHLGDVDDWTFGNEWVQWLAVDMVGSLALFLLVTIFLHISRQTRGEEVTEDVEAFIAIKKAITLVMALVAIAVGVWAFGESTWQVFSHLWHGDGLVIDINFVFYKDLFTVLVFADLLVLLAAYRYSSEFSLIFRNAGFTISTILLRLSMSVPRPWDVGVAVGAIVFGVSVLGIYRYYQVIRADEEVD